MSEPTVTYTFVNGAGNTADADEVNQNYTDILNAIKSGSSADLGCNTLKIAGGTFDSAVVSAMVGQDATFGNVSVTSSLSCADLTIDSESFASAAASAAATAFPFSEGEFTAAASGLTTGADAGTEVTFTAKYTRIGSTVNLYLPDHDSEQGGIPLYMITGLPADITPSSTMTIGCPTGAKFSGVNVDSAIAGVFGYSHLSGIFFDLGAGYWGDGSSALNGYTRDVVITYRLP